jgi:hypothetical protein
MNYKPLRQQKVSTMHDHEQYFISAEDVIVLPHIYFVRRDALLYETQISELCLEIQKVGNRYIVAFDALVFNEVREKWWQLWWYTFLAWIGKLTPRQSHGGIEEYNQFAHILRFDLFTLLENDYVFDSKEDELLILKHAKQRMQQLYEKTPVERFMKTVFPYMDEVVTEDIYPGIRQVLIEVIKEGIKKFIHQPDPVQMLDDYLYLIELQEIFFREYTKEVEARVASTLPQWEQSKRKDMIQEIDSMLEYVESKKLFKWLGRIRQILDDQVLELASPQQTPLEELHARLKSYIATEQYEKAAKLRDEIDALKNKK